MKNPKNTALIFTTIFVLMLIIFYFLSLFEIGEINTGLEAILVSLFFYPFVISLWFWSETLKISSCRRQKYYVSLRFVSIALTIFGTIQMILFFLEA